ncbi:MAG: hypothetical protein ACI93R_000414 [Flavobacteriales bacterium]|jgi:hypothetical protein
MKYLLLITTLALLSACGAQPTKEVTLPGIEGKFLSLGDTRLEQFLVRDEKQFSEYNKIAFYPLKIEGMTIEQTGKRRIDKSWTNLDVNDFSAQSTAFAKETRKLFHGNKEFTLTQKAEEKTLAVQVRFVRMYPNAPYPSKDIGSGINDETYRNFGKLAIQATVSDINTGELLAIIDDGFTLLPSGTGISSFGSTTTVDLTSRNTSASLNNAMRKGISQWLYGLRSDLVKLKKQ